MDTPLRYDFHGLRPVGRIFKSPMIGKGAVVDGMQEAGDVGTKSHACSEGGIVLLSKRLPTGVLISDFDVSCRTNSYW